MIRKRSWQPYLLLIAVIVTICMGKTVMAAQIAEELQQITADNMPYDEEDKGGDPITVKAGWIMEEDGWYYYDTSGGLVTEQWIGDYYVGYTGKMSTDQWVDKYYVGTDGKWIPGYAVGRWVRENGRWWYSYWDGSYPREKWEQIDNTWYYFDISGWMKTGWQQCGAYWYYLDVNGGMRSGWFREGHDWYYLRSTGEMATGWQRDGGNWYYLNGSGAMMTGWLISSGCWYHLSGNGAMSVGWMRDGSHWYFLTESGAMAVGWLQVNNDWYYMEGDGSMRTGWLQAGADWYYLGDSGAMVRGFLKLGKATYYMDHAGGAMKTGWVEDSGKRYYFYSDGSMARNTTIDGYNINALGETYVPAVSTIKSLLQKSLMPVGSTMYVYGGGWNHSDATRVGISPQWKNFYQRQDASYDYNQTRYQRENGLDCSGYIGWTVYNAFNTVSGNESYVASSTEVAANYALRGWGEYTDRSVVRNYKAGDIMSSTCGCHAHTWMVVGTCSDGSVVFVHSTPKGVQINGTLKPGGGYNSEAISLAGRYMKKYYSQWNSIFPNSLGTSDYFSHFSQMRWDLTGNKMMTDPEDYMGKNANEILKDLFQE